MSFPFDTAMGAHNFFAERIYFFTQQNTHFTWIGQVHERINVWRRKNRKKRLAKYVEWMASRVVEYSNTWYTIITSAINKIRTRCFFSLLIFSRLSCFEFWFRLIHTKLNFMNEREYENTQMTNRIRTHLADGAPSVFLSSRLRKLVFDALYQISPSAK